MSWPSILRIELARSVGVWCIPIAIAVGVFVGQGALWDNVSVWLNACSAIVETLLLIGPLFGAAAAWDAGTDSRSSFDTFWRLSPDRRLTKLLLSLSASGIAALVAYAVVALWFLVRTLPGATWGSPDWLWLLTGAFGLIAQVALGYAFGTYVKSRVAAPIAAFALFFGNQAFIQFLPALGSPKSLYLAFGLQQEQSVFNPINHGLIAWEGTWYVGVASVCAITLLWRAHVRTRAATIGSIAALLIAFAGFIGVETSPNGWILPQQSATEYSCTPDGVICVQRAFRAGLDELTPAARAMIGRVEGTPFAIEHLEQRPRGQGGLPSRGLAIHIDTLASKWVSDDLDEAATEWLDGEVGGYGPCASYHPANPVGNLEGYGSIVTAWMAGSPSSAIIESNAQARAQRTFAGWSQSQIRQWLTKNRSKICDSSLGAADFR